MSFRGSLQLIDIQKIKDSSSVPPHPPEVEIQMNREPQEGREGCEVYEHTSCLDSQFLTRNTMLPLTPDTH